MDEQMSRIQHQQGQEFQDVDREEREINPVELLLRLLEKWKIIMAAALLGTFLVGCYTFFLVDPTYKATAKLYVTNSNNSLVDLSAIQVSNYLAADYQEVFHNREVQEEVIERLQLPYKLKELDAMVDITNPANTRILKITITSKSPEEARDIANTYASVAQYFIEERMKSEQPTNFESAVVPEFRSSPSVARNLVIGFLLGAAIACLVIVILFVMDDRIRTSEDIEKHLSIPTLGMMPLNKCEAAAATKGKGKVRNTKKQGA